MAEAARLIERVLLMGMQAVDAQSPSGTFGSVRPPIALSKPCGIVTTAVSIALAQ